MANFILQFGIIRESMKMLYEKYDFTTDTNYQQIIDKLNLPYHLDGVIIDEFNNIMTLSQVFRVTNVEF